MPFIEGQRRQRESSSRRRKVSSRKKNRPDTAADAAAVIGKLGGAWARHAHRAAHWQGEVPEVATSLVADASRDSATAAVELARLLAGAGDLSDEDAAADAASLRTRIEYLRSRCDDPAAFDAAVAKNPQLLRSSPKLLARVEARYRRAPRDDAFLMSNGVKSDEGIERDDVFCLDEKKQEYLSSAKRTSLRPPSSSSAMQFCRRVSAEEIRGLLKSTLTGDEPFPEYKQFLMHAILTERPDLLMKKLAKTRVDQLEYLYGGLLMVKHGFQDKYAQQIELSRPLEDAKKKPEKILFREPPREKETSLAPHPGEEKGLRSSLPPEKKKAEDMSVLELFQAKLLDCGRSVFLDRPSGFAYGLETPYDIGPPPQEAAFLSKMQRDFVFLLRAHESLPMSLRKLLRYLRKHGWTEDLADDSAWGKVVLTMFDHGMLQVGCRQDGTPFEVW